MRLLNNLILLACICFFLTSCAAANTLPEPSSPTMIEQLLMAQAVEFSLEPKNPPSTIPIPPESSLCVKATGLRTNQQFMIGIISSWLGKQGFIDTQDCELATYRVQIIIQTLGTEQAVSLFGMPEVQGGILPFALPELAIYKVAYQTGYTRFALEFYENSTDKFLRATPWYRAKTYYNQYTILFFIEYQTTNLIEGPLEIEPFKHSESVDNTKDVSPLLSPNRIGESQETEPL